MAENTRSNTDGNQSFPPRESFNNQGQPGDRAGVNASTNKAVSGDQPSFDLMRELVSENEHLKDEGIQLRKENVRMEQELAECNIQITNLKSESQIQISNLKSESQNQINNFKSENMKLKLQVAELNIPKANVAKIMTASGDDTVNSQGITNKYVAEDLPKRDCELARKFKLKSALVSMQKRVAEGVKKFLEGDKTETDLYKSYEEWFEDISDRMNKDVPLFYEDFIMVKYLIT